MAASCNSVSSCITFTFQRVFPLMGILPYVLVDWVIIEDHSGQLKHPFYIMCLSLSFSDILGSINQEFTADIVSAIQTSTNNGMLFRFYGFVGRYFWYVCELHHLLIACTRFAAVFINITKQSAWENPKRLYFGLVACWITAAILNLPVMTEAAPYIYSPAMHQLTFNNSVPSAHVYQNVFDFGIQPCICGLQLLFYLAAAVKLHLISAANASQVHACTAAAAKPKRRKRTELAMLAQGFLSFLPIFAVVVCFHLMIYVQLSPEAFTVLGNTVDIFGYFVFMGSPYVYFAFNHVIRQKVYQKLSTTFTSLTKFCKISSGKHLTAGYQLSTVGNIPSRIHTTHKSVSIL